MTDRNRIKYRDLNVRLTPAQYHMLAHAAALAEAEIEAGDSGTRTDLAVLKRAWSAVSTAWTRAGMGLS